MTIIGSKGDKRKRGKRCSWTNEREREEEERGKRNRDEKERKGES